MAAATISKAERERRAERKLRKKTRQGFCGHTKRNGKPCMRDAGWGTDHPGVGTCKTHGGEAPAHRNKAAREETHAMARPSPATPGQGIMGILHLAAGHLAYVTSKVGEIQEDSIFEETPNGHQVLNRWMRMQREYMKDLATYCKAAADMGVQERQTQLAEKQTEMIQGLIEGIMGDLNLTREQRRLVGPAIRKRMAVIRGTGAELP